MELSYNNHLFYCKKRLLFIVNVTYIYNIQGVSVNVSDILRRVWYILTTRNRIARRCRWRCAKVPSFRARNHHFRQGHQVNRMVDYMNSELADMYLPYEVAD